MFFEDLPVGKRYETGSRTLTEAEIVGFARLYDPQPFHIDPDAARASPYGGIIASGFHTILTAFNLTLAASDWSESSMGSPGMREVRWIKPVRAGDSLRVVAEVLEARASASKPDRGFVTVQHDIYNQDGALVAAYCSTLMLRRRPPG